MIFSALIATLCFGSAESFGFPNGETGTREFLVDLDGCGDCASEQCCQAENRSESWCCRTGFVCGSVAGRCGVAPPPKNKGGLFADLVLIPIVAVFVIIIGAFCCGMASSPRPSAPTENEDGVRYDSPSGWGGWGMAGSPRWTGVGGWGRGPHYGYRDEATGTAGGMEENLLDHEIVEYSVDDGVGEATLE